MEIANAVYTPADVAEYRAKADLLFTRQQMLREEADTVLAKSEALSWIANQIERSLLLS